MPNADRAAVAREEVLRFLDEAHREGTPELFRLTGAQYSYLSGRAQATYPAAPEAVTVEVDGVPVSLTREPQRVVCLRGGVVPIALYAPESLAMFDRIASDARVIQERDARIAELEQLLRDQPLLLYDSAWQAIDRMGDAVGALTGPGSNCHTTAHRVCETIETLKDERDAALRALEQIKGEGLGHAAKPNSGVSDAAVGPSPAPSGIGAVVNDGRTAWHYEADEEGALWNATLPGAGQYTLVSYEGERHFDALTALYHARQELATRKVATRETVERARKSMAQAFRDTPVGGNFTETCTRAALTAAGFTLEEGA